MADLGHGNSVRHTNSSFVLLFEDNVGRLLVDSNTKTFELSLDNPLVGQGLVDIKDNKNKMTCLRNSYDLSASTLAILGSLNDTWQIEHLNGCTVILYLTRHGSQRRELICSS